MRLLLLLFVCTLILGCSSNSEEVPVLGAPGSVGSSSASSDEPATVANEDSGMSRQDPEAIIKRQDADGDGKLVGDEIPSWLVYAKGAFDTDDDGAISLAELQAGISQFSPPDTSGGGRRGGGGGGFDPTMMFANMDSNKDGKLIGDEIPDRMRENLEATDTDGDGAISMEELETRFRQFRGGRRGGADANRPERPQRPDIE